MPEQCPKLKIIYAHAGLPFWKKLWKYAKDQPNVFVDTSSDYLTPSIVKEVVEALGYRKVLYGCDGPYGMKQFNQYDYREKKSWIHSLPIPDHQKEYILGKNFLKLIAFILSRHLIPFITFGRSVNPSPVYGSGMDINSQHHQKLNDDFTCDYSINLTTMFN